MRIRMFTALLMTLWVGFAGASPSQGQEPDQGTTTTLTGLPGAVGIGDGFFFTGAVITPPDGGAPRTLDAYQAAVFVQSWLPSSVFGDREMAQDPPAELPVSRVDIAGQWGNGQPVGTMTVYFAATPTVGFVAFPQEQSVATEPGGEPPPPSGWFVPPSRVIDAFNGDAELIETAGTQAATSTTTAPGSTEPDASPADTSPADPDTWPGWAWVAVAGAGAGGAILVGLWLRRRTS